MKSNFLMTILCFFVCIGMTSAQEVKLNSSQPSSQTIIDTYESSAVHGVEDRVAVAQAYANAGEMAKSLNVYQGLFNESLLKEKPLMRYALVLMRDKQYPLAQTVLNEYKKYNAEEASYLIDICQASVASAEKPAAVRISDIPAYREYPKSMTNSNAKLVSQKRRVIEREDKVVVADAKVKKEAAFDLSLAKRISINALFPADGNAYFIQLASLSRSKGNAYVFKSLVSMGNIYKVREGGKVKIKLGYFYDEWEAQNVLATIKNMGYSDAFITTDNLNKSDLELALSKYDVTETSSASTSYTTESTTDYSNYEANTGPLYKVRLASYENPIWFDIEKARTLGNIEQWTKGGWTIFVLGGFNDWSDAESAKNLAVSKGFMDAEVVLDNGGILEKL